MKNYSNKKYYAKHCFNYEWTFIISGKISKVFHEENFMLRIHSKTGTETHQNLHFVLFIEAIAGLCGGRYGQPLPNHIVIVLP